MTDNFWDDADIIDVYTDEQAVEDGVLIPVKFDNITRITRTVFDDFVYGEHIDASAFNQFMNKAAQELQRQQHIRDDWFYSVEFAGRKYFICDNGNGFTLMKPEDY
jgi:type I site-specific restriction endonuclease